MLVDLNSGIQRTMIRPRLRAFVVRSAVWCKPGRLAAVTILGRGSAPFRMIQAIGNRIATVVPAPEVAIVGPPPNSRKTPRAM